MSINTNTISVDLSFGFQPSVTINLHSFNLGDNAMSWNYRVVYDPNMAEVELIGEYTIREVFYDENGEINFWSSEAAVPNGNSWEELQDEIAMYAEAYELPCLVLTVGEDEEETLVEWVDDSEATEETEEESDEGTEA